MAAVEPHAPVLHGACAFVAAGLEAPGQQLSQQLRQQQNRINSRIL